MANGRLRLSDTINVRNRDAETQRIVNEIKPNLDKAVDNIVNNFKAEIKTRTEEFKNGKYDSELEAVAEEAKRGLNAAAADLETKLSPVDKAAKELNDLINQGGSNAQKLKQASQTLTKANKDLNDQIAEFRASVEKFGKTGGEFIASSAMKILLG